MLDSHPMTLSPKTHFHHSTTSLTPKAHTQLNLPNLGIASPSHSIVYQATNHPSMSNCSTTMIIHMAHTSDTTCYDGTSTQLPQTTTLPKPTQPNSLNDNRPMTATLPSPLQLPKSSTPNTYHLIAHHTQLNTHATQPHEFPLQIASSSITPSNQPQLLPTQINHTYVVPSLPPISNITTSTTSKATTTIKLHANESFYLKFTTEENTLLHKHPLTLTPH